METIDLHGSRILVVDDNTANLGVLFNYLDRSGLTVLVCQDAETAVELVKTERPDIVLLDVMLPGMSGFDACRLLKSDPEHAEIPVIFISALSDLDDKVEGFKAGGVDYITKPFQQEEVLARIRAHVTIRRQQERLEELNATKDRFFSIIAHDLRGSFGGILTAVDLIRRSLEQLTPELLNELADNLHHSAETTYRLLENLLEWARLQQNSTEYNPEHLEPAPVILEIIDVYRLAAEQKGIKLSTTVEADDEFVADRGMFAAVMRNLVNNALKFTHPGGSVDVSVSRLDGMLAFTVRDTGVGISPSDREKLFRVDKKITSVGTSGEKGTGLGLLLVKEYVKKNRGNVSVESNHGAGTTITVTFPTVELPTP